LGISFDDQIEVFYELPSNKGSLLHKVVADHSETIKKVIKMPFLSADSKQKDAVVLGTTPVEHNDDKMILHIC